MAFFAYIVNHHHSRCKYGFFDFPAGNAKVGHISVVALFSSLWAKLLSAVVANLVVC